MAANDEILDGQKAAITRAENQAQVEGLDWLGRTVPVIGLAVVALVAWYADSTFLFVLAASGAALASLMLCLRFMLWRPQSRRGETQAEPDRIREVA